MRFLCGFVLLLSATANGYAQDAALRQEANNFALNNAVYVLYHEIGHLLIGEFGIPVLGKEEDAVDNLATLLLLVEETPEADQALIDSSDSWFLADQLSESDAYDDADFYDSHSLDVQRAYGLVCMMVGANSDVFGEVATNAGLDPDKQAACANEYEQTLQSWDAVLEPFTTEDAEKQEIDITYEPSINNADAARTLTENAILETAADYILRGYDLPRPIKMTAKDCGEANAYYDYDAAEIVFCYELMNDFSEKFIAGFGPTLN